MNVWLQTIIAAKIFQPTSLPFIIEWKKLIAQPISLSREPALASLAEFAAFSLPGILIPFPYATDDHQTRNAEIYARVQAAILLKESEVSGELLARKIRRADRGSGADLDRWLRILRASRRRTRPGTSPRPWKDIRLMKPVSEERSTPEQPPPWTGPVATSERAMPLDLPGFLTRERHRIHLVGVAGSGMSGIAALLIELGHTVSGSDKVSTMETDRLQRLGLRFHEQHRPEEADTADLVVFSSAIKSDNPILVSARNYGKPIVRRAEALAAIMRSKRGIVIAGMHGKTTTSAMTAHVLREGGLHPCHYVGAEIPILGTNAHWDARGEYFVAEGDESDGTIALFRPEHTLILNIEEEHLDFYADLDAIEKVFAQLITQTAGTVFYNLDDKNAARVCRSLPRGISTAFADDGRLSRSRYPADGLSLRCSGSIIGDRISAKLVLNVPGQHNVHNALGVIALASELGIAFEKIAKSLAKFEHARRRFEIKYDSPAFSSGGRLRASPDGNPRHAQGGEIGRPQARAHDVSTASLFAHQSVAEGIWLRVRRCGPRSSDRCLLDRMKRRFRE